MKNIIFIKVLAFCILASNISFMQNDGQEPIFNHSDKYSLDNEQMEIYNIITKQPHVMNPKIIVYKYQLALNEYRNLELNIGIDKSIYSKTKDFINRNQKHWTWIGTISNEQVTSPQCLDHV